MKVYSFANLICYRHLTPNLVFSKDHFAMHTDFSEYLTQEAPLHDISVANRNHAASKLFQLYL